jgi:hypothetical protein
MPVTESNLSLCVPAQVPAVIADVGSMPIKTLPVQMWVFCALRTGCGQGLLVDGLRCAGQVTGSPEWALVRQWDLGCVSDLQVCRAAYRNRTDGLRITRGMLLSRTRSSCTDSTGHRIDGTRGAGIIRRPGPRPGPRPRPCVPASCYCA